MPPIELPDWVICEECGHTPTIQRVGDKNMVTMHKYRLF